MNSTEACIALNMLPTVGPVRLRKLLEVFGTPERALTAKRHELRAVEGIGGEVADQIAAWESTVDLPAELNRIRDFGATVITRKYHHIPGRFRKFKPRQSCFTSGRDVRSGTITPSGSSAPRRPSTLEPNRS